MSHPPLPKKIKVAIVHDWLVGGGAEQVVYELHKLYPEAPIYTSYCTAEWRKKLDNKVITGYLQNWPFSKLRKILAVLRIWWFTGLDFTDYDLVISSSGNAEAFGIKTSKNTLHINYCHTPTHFYWRHYRQYLENPGVGIFNPLVRIGLRIVVGPLRRWDYKAAQRADYFIANSTHIQSDIKKYYGRDSTVIFPPVDVERFNTTATGKRKGFVVASRQVPQKKFDLAIEACNKLGLPLTVLGKGPEHKKLVAMGGPTINYVEQVSNSEMVKYFNQAEGFIWPCFDDFGITAVEAMAAGTPVIAYQAGGALDYVMPGKTGVFFKPQTAEALAKTLQNFSGSDYNSREIKQSATVFSSQEFENKMRAFITDKLGQTFPKTVK